MLILRGDCLIRGRLRKRNLKYAKRLVGSPFSQTIVIEKNWRYRGSLDFSLTRNEPRIDLRMVGISQS